MMLSQAPGRCRSVQSGSRSRSRNTAIARAVATAAAYQYRQGTSEDVEFIKKRLLLESMNPLGIKPENFTVVEDSNGAGTVAFAQLAPLPAQNTCEFRSLVVLPEHREFWMVTSSVQRLPASTTLSGRPRGKDIGTQLLQHIVQGSSANIYLTTVSKTVAFYQRAGFKLLQASEVPWFLWFEAAAGTVVAKIAVNDQLVVMSRPAQPSAQ